MNEKKLLIHTPFIKLEQAIKLAALTASGGEAKELIASGCVFVGEEKCFMRGKKLLSGDSFSVVLPGEKEKHSFLLYEAE